VKIQRKWSSMSRKKSSNEPMPAAGRRHASGTGVMGYEAWRQIAKSLRLSPREMEITRGIFNNHTEKAMADDLRLSSHTIHAHINRLFRKLNVNTRTDLVLLVVEQLLTLTRAEGSRLPPICPHHVKGDCPLQPPAA
jgi:DNA-binding CsgD family transcriptional regulator